MKLKSLRVTAILVLLIAMQSSFAAPAGEQTALATIANIMINLNHFPSASEKAQLRTIANDEAVSAHERAIATAMANLQHSATATDKRKLSKIMEDESAPAAVKEMASIIFHLNHKPSGEDKQKLKQMLK